MAKPREVLEGIALLFGATWILLHYVLWGALWISLIWDTLAWLTNNQQAWKNTAFRGALFSFGALIVWHILTALADKIWRAVATPPNAPPADPAERLKWANRLPPYDR